MVANDLKRPAKILGFIFMVVFVMSILCSSVMAADKPSGTTGGNPIQNNSVIVGDVYLESYDTSTIFRLIAQAARDDKDANVYYIQTTGATAQRGVYNLSVSFDTSGTASNKIVSGTTNTEFSEALTAFLKERAEYYYDTNAGKIEPYDVTDDGTAALAAMKALSAAPVVSGETGSNLLASYSFDNIAEENKMHIYYIGDTAPALDLATGWAANGSVDNGTANITKQTYKYLSTNATYDVWLVKVAELNVTMTIDGTDDVTLTIADIDGSANTNVGKNYIVMLGEVALTLGGTNAGDYEITGVTLDQDGKFTAASQTYTVTVSKKVTADDGTAALANIKVLDFTLSGENVALASYPYDKAVDDVRTHVYYVGTGTPAISNLPTGWAADGAATTGGNITKQSYKYMDTDVTYDVWLWNVAQFNVTFENDATGTVTIKYNDGSVHTDTLTANGSVITTLGEVEITVSEELEVTVTPTELTSDKLTATSQEYTVTVSKKVAADSYESRIQAAVTSFNTKFASITGQGSTPIVEITGGTDGAYALVLDMDAIESGNAAFEDTDLSGLITELMDYIATAVGNETTVSAGVGNGTKYGVYTSSVIQNTPLKNLILDLASGGFETLANMTETNGAYTFKTMNLTLSGSDGSDYNFSVAIQLKGEDVSKVISLSSTIAVHIQMETLSATDISTRYGVTVDEGTAAVITVEMPDALMDTLKGSSTGSTANSAEGIRTIFNNFTVAESLALFAKLDVSSIIGGNESEVNSVLSTINSNANLINKVLEKLTITVGNNTLINSTGFNPTTGETEWAKLLSGLSGMLDETIGDTTLGSYQVTSIASKDGDYNYGDYYVVPVTVAIDLDASAGFNATETILVVLHIPFIDFDN